VRWRVRSWGLARGPQRVSTSVLIRHLRIIQDGVGTGDSLEGSFEYHASETPGFWDVTAAYRIGNRDGQGFVTLIGTDEPE